MIAESPLMTHFILGLVSALAALGVGLRGLYTNNRWAQSACIYSFLKFSPVFFPHLCNDKVGLVVIVNFLGSGQRLGAWETASSCGLSSPSLSGGGGLRGMLALSRRLP